MILAPHEKINWLIVLGLNARQSLWVILCRLQEKGRTKTNRNESDETEEIKTFPSTLTYYKDSRPCPAVSQYHLDTRWHKIHDTFATHPLHHHHHHSPLRKNAFQFLLVFYVPTLQIWGWNIGGLHAVLFENILI